MIEAKISRAEAAALVNKRLSPDSEKQEISHVNNGRTHGYVRQWHYGRIELRELLDAIYGPPVDDSEKVSGTS